MDKVWRKSGVSAYLLIALCDSGIRPTLGRKNLSIKLFFIKENIYIEIYYKFVFMLYVVGFLFFFITPRNFLFFQDWARSTGLVTTI